jgi:hypothetical protein
MYLSAAKNLTKIDLTSGLVMMMIVELCIGKEMGEGMSHRLSRPFQTFLWMILAS